MSLHRATIDWRRTAHASAASTYSRNHKAVLAGQSLEVSSSPEYQGDPECADPEQLLLTALASCHLLTFLAIAEIQGYRVESYRDAPVAHLEKNAAGRMAVTRIELSPEVSFAGERRPDATALAKLHDSAHRNCFIASSISARVTVNPATA